MAKRLVLTPGQHLGGTLFYIKDIPTNTKDRVVLTRCSCGNKKQARLNDIRQGKTIQCSFCREEATSIRCTIDISGHRFGRWTAITPIKHKTGKWLCRCDCGTEKTVAKSSLMRGVSLSCGCLHKEQLSRMMTKPIKIGSTIGDYTVIERVENKNRKHRYLVRDNITGNTKILVSSVLRKSATDIGLLKNKLCSRLREMIKRKRFKTSLPDKFQLPYTEEELLAHIGKKPGRTYHIDHICPCDQAQAVDELFALFALENLQYLPGAQNLRKSNKWTPEGERLCNKLLNRPWKYKQERNQDNEIL